MHLKNWIFYSVFERNVNSKAEWWKKFRVIKINTSSQIAELNSGQLKSEDIVMIFSLGNLKAIKQIQADKPINRF